MSPQKGFKSQPSPSSATTGRALVPAISNPSDHQSDEGAASSLKRKHADGSANSPRRRATIACDVCRSRKSRCDGAKPQCKLCREIGAECIYREPGIKLDAGDKLILERLDRIEGMLQFGGFPTNQDGSSANMSDASPALSIGTCPGGGSGDATANMSSQNIQVPISPGGGLASFTQSFAGMKNLSTMPKAHTTAALHLLKWPLIGDLVAQQYDSQFLLQLEMERNSLHSIMKAPRLDLSNAQAYINAFFETANVWYACVNPYTWESLYRTALANGFRGGPESCIVLLVLALGEASLGGSISKILNQEEPPGLQHFTAAWALLPGMTTANNVLAAQCHLLAAAYLLYTVRPLEAWNLLCTASTKLQLLLMEPSRIPVHQRQLVERIYWNTVLFESDLLSELDLPHSGVVEFEGRVGLPGAFEEDSAAAAGEDDPAGHDQLWYFLAGIALRRLLNRVSRLIYSRDSPAAAAASNTAALDPVVAELDAQLTRWYESLPLPVQFPFARTMLHDPVRSVLRLRFFACRTIIYRPYVLAVLDNEAAALDSTVLENCRRCLEACVRQLENLSEHHAGHMPYIWQGALSTVSQTLLVMGASLSAPLLGVLLTLVPHRETLDQIIGEVVMEMQRYAVLAPSLSLAAEIIKEAEERRQAIMRGGG